MILIVIKMYFVLGVLPESQVLVNAITLKMHQNYHQPFINAIKGKHAKNCTNNQTLVMPTIHVSGAILHRQLETSVTKLKMLQNYLLPTSHAMSNQLCVMVFMIINSHVTQMLNAHGVALLTLVKSAIR